MKTRLEELDSLRGFAAIFVVFLHMYLMVPGDKFLKIIFEYSPFRLFTSGGESVVLFFVLSGFVLSLPYFNNKQSSYFSFVVKRICRIYLPYLFTVIVAIICRELFYSGQLKGYSEWFNTIWISSISMEVIEDHVILIGTFLSNLDPVVWSLLHEMRISIIFPVLMILIVRLNWKQGLALSLLFSLIGMIIYQLSKPTNTGTELVATINYIAMFVIGALLAKYRMTIANKFSLLTKKSKVILFVIGLIIYLFLHPSFGIKLFLYPEISPFYRTVIDSWAVTGGGVILIIFALNSSLFSRLLRNYLINYLGKISYSLYLIHVVVLFSAVHRLHNILPLWCIFLLTLIISLIISVGMYHLIERPSIQLGKALTKRIFRRSKPQFNNEFEKRFN
ncbi:acyltransferase family protein [Paenibacillus planticolens]|uniref:Acyltransferase family protein n=1 Tax=Paenibacillus planticolens TaxID=2654976 RepID=A0ABX1ZNL4_9BACL|nr:acyltransferase [Paenibacillus planticolens]NOV00210.1 acyltransferase family protein [Paenibacillus planticolens]